MKPENLLYLTRAADSQLVLADFGIAKMMHSPTDVLTSMAGSFGYAAPEIMMKQGHGKAVDMWSLGVITYTLLCGYSPFRAETLNDLIEECRSGRIVFHERYWRDVSQDAKDFILTMLNPDPAKRVTSEEALHHKWLTGESASDRDLLPEIRAYIARARLRRGIELVKLANRIESLKMHEDEDGEDIPSPMDMGASGEGEGDAAPATNETSPAPAGQSAGKRWSAARGAIFREVVLAKVREQKENEEREKVEREAREKAASP